MKKILIVMNCLDSGGATTSLLNLVNKLHLKYEITLLFFRENKENFAKVPSDVKIITTNDYLATFVAGLKNSRCLGMKRYCFKFIMGCWNKIFKTNIPFLKFALKRSLKLSGFDYAISFFKPTNKHDVWAGAANFVLSNVEATKKYVFIHDDYMPADFDKYTLSLYEGFDKIFAVSKSVRDKIVQNVPSLQNKLDYIYNFCPRDEIVDKSKDEQIKLSNQFNIISVARLSKEKGLIRALEAINKLKNQGYKFVYNIVGSGVEEINIRKYIDYNNLGEYVKLWGYKANPYPYIKSADLMLSPSYRESFGISLVESMLLGVPVLSTETTSAKEIVGNLGFICNNSTESIYLSLLEILQNQHLINEKKLLLENYMFDNDAILKKYDEIFK